MPVKKFKEFLDRTGQVCHHQPPGGFYAGRLSPHSGRTVLKTVMVKVDGKIVPVVLPASYQKGWTSGN